MCWCDQSLTKPKSAYTVFWWWIILHPATATCHRWTLATLSLLHCYYYGSRLDKLHSLMSPALILFVRTSHTVFPAGNHPNTIGIFFDKNQVPLREIPLQTFYFVEKKTFEGMLPWELQSWPLSVQGQPILCWYQCCWAKQTGQDSILI